MDIALLSDELVILTLTPILSLIQTLNLNSNPI